MDDIQTRLQETSKNCLEAYAGWEGKRKDSAAQETLGAAIHELRKVASRLEIELAISERDQMTSKPLPIPAHRANSKKRAENAQGGDDAPTVEKAIKKRRPPRRDSDAKEANGNG